MSELKARSPMPKAIDWPDLAARFAVLRVLPVAARHASRALCVEPGTTLFCREQPPRAMYFVVAGEIRLVRPSVTGAEIVLQRKREGFIAEASLGQAAYHCDGVAARTSTVVAIPLAAMTRAFECEDFRDAWIDHLAHEVRRLRAHAERLCLRSARERIVHFIEAEGRDGRLVLDRSKKDWAGELGLTHEALYRALAAMSRDGVLTVDGAALALAAAKPGLAG